MFEKNPVKIRGLFDNSGKRCMVLTARMFWKLCTTITETTNSVAWGIDLMIHMLTSAGKISVESYLSFCREGKKKNGYGVYVKP